MDRQAFRDKVHQYRRPTGRTQIELADALGIAEKVLSRKLNAKENAILTHFEIKQIVRTLAQWHGITTKKEAHSLLGLLDLLPAFFTPEEWNTPPLNRLDTDYDEEAEETSPDTAAQLAGSNPGQDETVKGDASHSPDRQGDFLPKPLHNLPVFPTPLIGREKSINDVCSLLQQPDVQIVTLTGPGGIGKTRLSVQVASNLSGQFRHGVWFIPLASLSDASLVLPTIARNLDLISSENSRPTEDILITYLRDKQILLILDNFEQVTDATSALGKVLAGAPGLKILVTSRIALRLYGEHEYNVPLLSLPNSNSPVEIKDLENLSAVRLFVQRARAIKADFELTPDNAQVVAQICSRLDGLPLAIELAATRIRLFSPQLLLTRLEHRLAMLTGGTTTLPERQKTVRATIQWSYTLLDEAEKALFARMSIFTGGGTLEAVEAVCGAETLAYLDLPTGLDSLIAKSLLYRKDTSDGEVRFFMLETIREFAQQCLAESSEFSTIQEHYADYYIGLAESTAPLLSTAQLTKTLERLTLEIDNLRSVCKWSLIQPAAEATLRIVGPLQLFWYWRGHVDEGRRWLEAGLARSQGVSAAVVAKAYRCAGLLAWAQGAYTQALVYDNQSFTLYQSLGDKRGMAEALNSLANSSSEMGDDTTARQYYEQSLEYYRASGYVPGIAMVLSNLGELLVRTSEYTAAKAYYEESLALKRKSGNPGSIALVLSNLGEIAFMEGNDELAVEYLEEGLRLAKSVNTPHIIGLCLEDLAKVNLRKGSVETALKILYEALRQLRLIHNNRALLYNLEAVAGAFGFASKPDVAIRLFGAAEALRGSLQIPLAPGDKNIYEWLRSGLEADKTISKQLWATEWTIGQNLTLEEAVDYALGFETSITPGEMVRNKTQDL